MACPSGKIQHATYEAAEAHQKSLVFKNQSAGESERSNGLHVYQCLYAVCGAWHVGHTETPVGPRVYHYTIGKYLDEIVAAGELRPYQHPSDTTLAGLEPHALLWFSRNPVWEHSVLKDPRPRDKRSPPTGRAVTEMSGKGLFRWAAYQSVAKLRWNDYLDLNKIHPIQREAMSLRGNPVDWLATNQPVSLSECWDCEVYYEGLWVNAFTLDGEKFERYLASRMDVYNAAWLRVQDKILTAQDSKIVLTDEAEIILYDDWTLECDEKDWIENQKANNSEKFRQYKALVAQKRKFAELKHQKNQRKRRKKR